MLSTSTALGNPANKESSVPAPNDVPPHPVLHHPTILAGELHHPLNFNSQKTIVSSAPNIQHGTEEALGLDKPAAPPPDHGVSCKSKVCPDPALMRQDIKSSISSAPAEKSHFPGLPNSVVKLVIL